MLATCLHTKQHCNECYRFSGAPQILHGTYYTEVGGAEAGFVVRVWPAHEYCLLAPPIVVEPCAYHLCFLLSGKTGSCFVDHVSAEMYVSTIFLCSYWSFNGWPSTLQLCSTSRFSSSLTKSSLWGPQGTCVCVQLFCFTSSIEEMKLSGNVYRVGVCDPLILQAAL